MTTSDILNLMLAREKPLPPFAALDLVMTHRECDVTDATYALFVAAGERLEASLGAEPESLPESSNYGAYEARENLRIAWQVGRKLVDLVKGNYADFRVAEQFRSALRNVPGLNVAGVKSAIVKMGFQHWVEDAERCLRLLQEIEILEAEALTAKGA